MTSSNITVATADGGVITALLTVTDSSTMPTGIVISNGHTWAPVISQDFLLPAALGQFEATYPKWSGYDFANDTSKNNGRPKTTQGYYNSYTVCTVANSIFDAYLHTGTPDTGSTTTNPQIAALTPAAAHAYNSGANNGTYGSMYGRYSVRWRTDTIPGYKLAFLLWPNSEMWSDGEVDFPEVDLGGTVKGYSHDNSGTPSNNAWAVNTTTDSTLWHTTTIEWMPGRLEFFVDGVSQGFTGAVNAIPKVPFHWALQIETNLSSTPPAASVAGHVQIDWLVEYAMIL